MDYNTINDSMQEEIGDIKACIEKYLESDIVDLYEKQDAKLLPPWDPMGALAR